MINYLGDIQWISCLNRNLCNVIKRFTLSRQQKTKTQALYHMKLHDKILSYSAFHNRNLYILCSAYAVFICSKNVFQ